VVRISRPEGPHFCGLPTGADSCEKNVPSGETGGATGPVNKTSPAVFQRLMRHTTWRGCCLENLGAGVMVSTCSNGRRAVRGLRSGLRSQYGGNINVVGRRDPDSGAIARGRRKVAEAGQGRTGGGRSGWARTARTGGDRLRRQNRRTSAAAFGVPIARGRVRAFPQKRARLRAAQGRR
jgi:hypothetical protein